MFNLELPRSNPSLPQNDTPHQLKRREEQLSDARGKFVWTTTLPNVVGVPMAKHVPLSDEPTLEWLLKVADVAFVVIENLLENLVGKLKQEEHGLVKKELLDLKLHLAEARLKHKEHGAPEVASLIGDAITRLRTVVAPDKESVSKIIDRLQTLSLQFKQHMAGSRTQLQDYADIFKAIELPEIAHEFQEDATFARMRVAGPNPMLIKGISQLPTNFPLSAAQYAQVMAGDSLSAASKEGRLYLLDYAQLQAMVDSPASLDPLKVVYAPIALFALPKGEAELTPVAIQCGQDPAKFPLLLKPAADKASEHFGWLMAKTVVQVADGNYHELFVHLARTHLVLEAFVVATHRQLADQHPLNILLIPHFEGSLFINNAAAGSLIAEGGAINTVFGSQITTIQSSAGGDRLAFDFWGSMLPTELAARKVDDPARLPYFPYRDDALLVWHAIEKWAGEYVGLYYVDDNAVVGDTELAAWSADLVGQGLLKGFKPITNRADLIQVLTMVMFTASAQHAAVNFPQRTIMSYAPSVTGAGWATPPKSTKGHTEQQWVNMMPPIDVAMDQLNILYLLGSVYYRRLGEYKSNHFPYLNWFRDKKVEAPLARFNAELEKIEGEITLRNQLREPNPYPYLLPSQIPPSINI